MARPPEIPRIPIEIPITVTSGNDMPQIQLKRTIGSGNNSKLLKVIIYCALNNIPLYFVPTFRHKLNSMNSMIQKGIISEKDSNLEFNI